MINFFKRAGRKIIARSVPYNVKYRPQKSVASGNVSFFKEIYPAEKSVLRFQTELYEESEEYVNMPRSTDAPPAVVKAIPQGRIYATPSYTAIIDSHNHLVQDVSYQFLAMSRQGDHTDNEVFKTRFFIDPVKYKGAVFCMLAGGGAVHNYGHWLIDVLPRIDLLKKSGLFEEVDWFLVPNYQHDFQKESLSLLGIPADKVIVAATVNHIQADRIIACSSPRHQGHFPRWAGKFLRDSIPDQTNSFESPPLVYIRRSDSAIRRILNEDELVDALKKYGFVDFELSRLSFYDKINLFRSAEVVISATGAGLSNIVFCREGTKIFEIFHANYLTTMFADIATKMDLDYHFLIKESRKKVKQLKEGAIGHFSVDVKKVVNHALKAAPEVNPDQSVRRI